jgi:hypothetical protein
MLTVKHVFSLEISVVKSPCTVPSLLKSGKYLSCLHEYEFQQRTFKYINKLNISFDVLMSVKMSTEVPTFLRNMSLNVGTHIQAHTVSQLRDHHRQINK